MKKEVETLNEWPDDMPMHPYHLTHQAIPQRASDKVTPPQQNDKVFLCVPDPYNSKRWEEDEGHSYKGEIFRVRSCCKAHAAEAMFKKHPDVFVLSVHEETPEVINDIPLTYQIVEA